MLIQNRTLFIAVAVCGLFASFANAQSSPGSFDELLETEFAPLKPVPQLPDLHAPLVMGPQENEKQERSKEPKSVIEVPQVQSNDAAPKVLVLPNLTIPTPENTAADRVDSQTVLRPGFGERSDDDLQLLPFNERNDARLRQPTLQPPRALPYGSNSRSFYSSTRRLAVPIQVEFFSFGNFGFQPFPAYGYRPYGGYVPYGGYRSYGGFGGRNCPYGRR